MSLLEKLLVNLECRPWAALYRILVGVLLIPVYMAVTGGHLSDIWLVAFLFAILIALRIVPMVARRVVSFSKDAKAIWWHRRSLAKKFDSYQWQKLFWVGLGIFIYLGVRGNPARVSLYLAIACVVFGGLGLLFWIRHRVSVNPS